MSLLKKIVIHDYAGHVFAIHLARILANEYEVHYICATGLETPQGKVVKSDHDSKNLHIHKIKLNQKYKKNKYSFIKRWAYEKEYGKKIKIKLLEINPDVITSANTPTEIQSYIISASKKCRAKFIYWLQDFYSIAVKKLLKKKSIFLSSTVGNYYKYLDKKHFSEAEKIIAISINFKKILITSFKIKPKKIEVIQNWSPINELPILSKRNEWSKNNKLTNKFVFMYSGTLGMKHNPEYLLKLSQYFQKISNVEIVVVSEGIGRSYLEKKKKELQLKNMSLFDYAPYSKLPEILSTADVFIALLEKSAGQFSVPSKVLTYHVFGKPTLISAPAENQASKLIKEEDSGIATTPGDYTAFLKSANELFNNKDLQTRQSLNSRDYALRAFSDQSIKMKFKDIFL